MAEPPECRKNFMKFVEIGNVKFKIVTAKSEDFYEILKEFNAK